MKHTLTFTTHKQTEMARNWLLTPTTRIFVEAWTEGLNLYFTTESTLDEGTQAMILEKLQPLDRTFNEDYDEETPDLVDEIYRRVESPGYGHDDEEPRDEPEDRR